MTKNENRINKLFEELVPTSGKADSLAGELVRATARIGYRFFNDGDMVNQGYGKETCNPAARFLIAKGNAEISSLTVALWEIFSEDAYEKVLDIYKDLRSLEKSVGDNDEESSSLDLFSLEMFENIAYIMAKHAHPDQVPDTPDEWLENFNTFAIYQILPQLIELWGLNVQTEVEARKNLAKVSG